MSSFQNTTVFTLPGKKLCMCISVCFFPMQAEAINLLFTLFSYRKGERSQTTVLNCKVEYECVRKPAIGTLVD